MRTAACTIPITAARLAIDAIEPVVLRRENGQDVAGWLVSARLP